MALRDGSTNYLLGIVSSQHGSLLVLASLCWSLLRGLRCFWSGFGLNWHRDRSRISTGPQNPVCLATPWKPLSIRDSAPGWALRHPARDRGGWESCPFPHPWQGDRGLPYAAGHGARWPARVPRGYVRREAGKPLAGVGWVARVPTGPFPRHSRRLSGRDDGGQRTFSPWQATNLPGSKLPGRVLCGGRLVGVLFRPPMGRTPSAPTARRFLCGGRLVGVFFDAILTPGPTTSVFASPGVPLGKDPVRCLL
jgi:hypothetical protein